MGSHVGIITNGLGGNKVKHWDWFDWVRVSLNTLEYADLNLDYLKGIPTSFCYIWNENSRDKIRKVVEFANDHKTICRIAPDCIVSLYGIEKQVDTIRAVLNHGFPNNEYAFLSDFNIDTERPHHRCYIHMIKPCFYLDGWVYACPSAELAMENDKQIQPKTRICEYDKIADWYNSPEALKPKELDCSYCKYVQQQEFLEMALTETEFNEFA